MSGIREVARLAGVSPATVSRVMNGTARVNAEKKERVLRAIADTGFVPNEVARSLFRKSAKMIGLILPNIDNPFFTQLADAIEREADMNGYRVLLYNTRNDFEKEKIALQMLTSMNADGIILTRSNELLQPYVEEIPVPVVITDTFFQKGKASAYVHCDFLQGGQLATEHLLACGCKNIVCMKGPQTLYSAKARYQGYQKVCETHGLKEQAVETDYSFCGGLEAAEELLCKYPQADGVVACNDMVAISAYKVFYEHKIAVPEQIQIVGFDDIFLSSLVTPELTTITQPIGDIGAKAVELIVHGDVERMCGKKYVFPVSLVERQTTKRE